MVGGGSSTTTTHSFLRTVFLVVIVSIALGVWFRKTRSERGRLDVARVETFVNERTNDTMLTDTIDALMNRGFERLKQEKHVLVRYHPNLKFYDDAIDRKKSFLTASERVYLRHWFLKYKNDMQKRDLLSNVVSKRRLSVKVSGWPVPPISSKRERRHRRCILNAAHLWLSSETGTLAVDVRIIVDSPDASSSETTETEDILIDFYDETTPPSDSSDPSPFFAYSYMIADRLGFTLGRSELVDERKHFTGPDNTKHYPAKWDPREVWPNDDPYGYLPERHVTEWLSWNKNQNNPRSSRALGPWYVFRNAGETADIAIGRLHRFEIAQLMLALWLVVKNRFSSDKFSSVDDTYKTHMRMLMDADTNANLRCEGQWGSWGKCRLDVDKENPFLKTARFSPYYNYNPWVSWGVVGRKRLDGPGEYFRVHFDNTVYKNTRRFAEEGLTDNLSLYKDGFVYGQPDHFGTYPAAWIGDQTNHMFAKYLPGHNGSKRRRWTWTRKNGCAMASEATDQHDTQACRTIDGYRSHLVEVHDPKGVEDTQTMENWLNPSSPCLTSSLSSEERRQPSHVERFAPLPICRNRGHFAPVFSDTTDTAFRIRSEEHIDHCLRHDGTWATCDLNNDPQQWWSNCFVDGNQGCVPRSNALTPRTTQYFTVDESTCPPGTTDVDTNECSNVGACAPFRLSENKRCKRHLLMTQDMYPAVWDSAEWVDGKRRVFVKSQPSTTTNGHSYLSLYHSLSGTPPVDLTIPFRLAERWKLIVVLYPFEIIESQKIVSFQNGNVQIFLKHTQTTLEVICTSTGQTTNQLTHTFDVGSDTQTRQNDVLSLVFVKYPSRWMYVKLMYFTGENQNPMKNNRYLNDTMNGFPTMVYATPEGVVSNDTIKIHNMSSDIRFYRILFKNELNHLRNAWNEYDDEKELERNHFYSTWTGDADHTRLNSSYTHQKAFLGEPNIPQG